MTIEDIVISTQGYTLDKAQQVLSILKMHNQEVWANSSFGKTEKYFYPGFALGIDSWSGVSLDDYRTIVLLDEFINMFDDLDYI